MNYRTLPQCKTEMESMDREEYHWMVLCGKNCARDIFHADHMLVSHILMLQQPLYISLRILSKNDFSSMV